MWQCYISQAGKNGEWKDKVLSSFVGEIILATKEVTIYFSTILFIVQNTCGKGPAIFKEI